LVLFLRLPRGGGGKGGEGGMVLVKTRPAGRGVMPSCPHGGSSSPPPPPLKPMHDDGSRVNSHLYLEVGGICSAVYVISRVKKLWSSILEKGSDRLTNPDP
jgi:hypothetical protein